MAKCITPKGLFTRYVFVACEASATGGPCNVVLGWHDGQTTWLRTSPITKMLGNAVITESGSLYYLDRYDPSILADPEALRFMSIAFHGWRLLGQ